jgi:hypothetical protein
MLYAGPYDDHVDHADLAADAASGPVDVHSSLPPEQQFAHMAQLGESLLYVATELVGCPVRALCLLVADGSTAADGVLVVNPQRYHHVYAVPVLTAGDNVIVLYLCSCSSMSSTWDKLRGVDTKLVAAAGAEMSTSA